MVLESVPKDIKNCPYIFGEFAENFTENGQSQWSTTLHWQYTLSYSDVIHVQGVCVYVCMCVRVCACVCLCVCVVRGHRSVLAVVLRLLLSASPCVSSLLRNCLVTFLSSSSSSSSCSTRCVFLVFLIFYLLLLFGVSAV